MGFWSNLQTSTETCNIKEKYIRGVCVCIINNPLEALSWTFRETFRACLVRDTLIIMITYLPFCLDIFTH